MMAHSEIYPDGSKIEKFFKAKNMTELSEKFGKLSSQAFLNGAEKVEQKVIHGNEVCPKCDSGLRYDLCCGSNEPGMV
jgi:hypothetical protein